jgi:DNA polymerase III alpha subunit
MKCLIWILTSAPTDVKKSIDYVKRKYGEDHVSQIITINRMKAKAVVKECSPVLLIYLFLKQMTSANLLKKIHWLIQIKHLPSLRSFQRVIKGRN